MEAEKKIEETQAAIPDNGGTNAVILFVNENMPELKDATDEEKYAAVAETLKKNKVFHEKMEALFASEPMLGQLITGVIKDDKPFLATMAELMSPDEYSELLENEGGDVIKTRDERLNRLKEIEDKEAGLSANVEASAKNIEAWLASKTDWDEAKKQDFMDKISVIFDSLADGKLSADELEQFAHMIYFDDALSQAREEGIVAGRNEKIDDKRLKEKVAKGTDGLPALAGGGNAGIPEDTPPPAKNPFADVLAMRGRKIY